MSFFLVSYQKHVLALNIIFNVNSRIARTNISYADKNAGMLAHGFFYFCIWRHRESVISLLFGTILTGFKDKHCCGCHKASRALLLHTRWKSPLMGSRKGGSKYRFHAGLLHKSHPGIAWKSCSRQIYPITLDDRLIYHAITQFFIQFPFSRFEICPITPSRFPLGGSLIK